MNKKYSLCINRERSESVENYCTFDLLIIGGHEKNHQKASIINFSENKASQYIAKGRAIADYALHT